jgi:hypothetical protein
MTYQPPASLELIGQTFPWLPLSSGQAYLTVLAFYSPLPTDWIDHSEKIVTTPPNALKGETGGVRVVRSKTYGEVKPQYAAEAATFRANRFAHATETLRQVVEAGFVVHDAENDTYVRTPPPVTQYVEFDSAGNETVIPFSEMEQYHADQAAKKYAGSDKARIARLEEEISILLAKA